MSGESGPGEPPFGFDDARGRFEAERQRQRELRELAALIREDLTAEVLEEVRRSGIRQGELAEIVREAVRNELEAWGYSQDAFRDPSRGDPARLHAHGGPRSKGSPSQGHPFHPTHARDDRWGSQAVGGGSGWTGSPDRSDRSGRRAKRVVRGPTRKGSHIFRRHDLWHWLPILVAGLLLAWVGACSGWMPWSGGGGAESPGTGEGPLPAAVADSAGSDTTDARVTSDSASVEPAPTDSAGTGAAGASELSP